MSQSSERIPHETRRLILQVAHRSFMEQGYRAVSTRQIAAECGITQPALYRHFVTKQDLYVAMLLETLQNLYGRLLHIVERNNDVIQRLQLIARMLPATWEDSQQMFHDIEHELDAQSRLTVSKAFRDQVLEPISSLFVEGIAQGLLRDPEHGGLDAKEATFVLLRLLDDHPSSESPAHSRIRHADQMVDILLHGLAHDPRADT